MSPPGYLLNVPGLEYLKKILCKFPLFHLLYIIHLRTSSTIYCLIMRRLLINCSNIIIIRMRDTHPDRMNLHCQVDAFLNRACAKFLCTLAFAQVELNTRPRRPSKTATTHPFLCTHPIYNFIAESMRVNYTFAYRKWQTKSRTLSSSERDVFLRHSPHFCTTSSIVVGCD